MKELMKRMYKNIFSQAIEKRIPVADLSTHSNLAIVRYMNFKLNPRDWDLNLHLKCSHILLNHSWDSPSSHLFNTSFKIVDDAVIVKIEKMTKEWEVADANESD